MADKFEVLTVSTMASLIATEEERLGVVGMTMLGPEDVDMIAELISNKLG